MQIEVASCRNRQLGALSAGDVAALDAVRAGLRLNPQ